MNFLNAPCMQHDTSILSALTNLGMRVELNSCPYWLISSGNALYQ